MIRGRERWAERRQSSQVKSPRPAALIYFAGTLLGGVLILAAVFLQGDNDAAELSIRSSPAITDSEKSAVRGRQAEPPAHDDPVRVSEDSESSYRNPTPLAVREPSSAARRILSGPTVEPTLELRLVDEEGRGVEGAHVVVRRPSKNGQVQVDAILVTRSNPNGCVWISRTSRLLDVTVAHPDFVTLRVILRPEPTATTLVLRQQAVLRVSGWFGSEENQIVDLDILIDDDSPLPPGAWARGLDGRFQTHCLAPGPHRALILYDSGRLASAIELFDLPEQGSKELHLELLPCLQLQGEIDLAVPRPVSGGRVRFELQAGGGPTGGPRLHHSIETDIRADGTFVFEAVPRGMGQVFALCDGWSSQLADGLFPQIVGDLAGGERLVVSMHRTSALELRVNRPDGQRLADAVVGVEPTVRWTGDTLELLSWREWQCTTDGSGLALITDIPPGSHGVRIDHVDYSLTPTIRDARVNLSFGPGETTSWDVTLVARREGR